MFDETENLAMETLSIKRNDNGLWFAIYSQFGNKRPPIQTFRISQNNQELLMISMAGCIQPLYDLNQTIACSVELEQVGHYNDVLIMYFNKSADSDIITLTMTYLIGDKEEFTISTDHSRQEFIELFESIIPYRVRRSIYTKIK